MVLPPRRKFPPPTPNRVKGSPGRKVFGKAGEKVAHIGGTAFGNGNGCTVIMVRVYLKPNQMMEEDKKAYSRNSCTEPYDAFVNDLKLDIDNGGDFAQTNGFFHVAKVLKRGTTELSKSHKKSGTYDNKGFLSTWGEGNEVEQMQLLPTVKRV
jgi:hypothetical protein